MKQLLQICCLSLPIAFLFNSCKKEYSCERCSFVSANIPPQAVAGADQTILLPQDSAILDASNSFDPDGKVVSYRWEKITGPNALSISSNVSSRVVVKNLISGTYGFLLTVTDNNGATGSDTINVAVKNKNANLPPVAIAGNDTTIVLPNNSAALSGQKSYDPDGTITTYTWAKISGPVSGLITNISTVTTSFQNLVAGNYQVELKVTDDGGLSSKDTVRVAVVNQVDPCNISSRPVGEAYLRFMGRLSQPRASVAVGHAAQKIVFAGGFLSLSSSSRVDIYDLTSHTWGTAELSQARGNIAVAVVGNKIFFAGGQNGNGDQAYDNVDIHDALTNTWSVQYLSSRRGRIAAASVGNLAIFAGGGSYPPFVPSTNRVDIYDASTGRWTQDRLSSARFDISAITFGDKVYFAGGTDDAQNSFALIDVFESSTRTWSTSLLNNISDGTTGLVANNLAFWAGLQYTGTLPVTSRVEIRNMQDQTYEVHCLSYLRYRPEIVRKDIRLAFFTGTSPTPTNRFDIYDLFTKSWSIGTLPQTVSQAGLISVNNLVYVAGGFIDGNISNQVWLLEF